MADLNLSFEQNKKKIRALCEALGSETRIRILEAILTTKDANHSELATEIEMSESSITHHIRYFLDCGIIKEESKSGLKGRLKKVPTVKYKRIVINL